jgi:hypothetical protein
MSGDHTSSRREHAVLSGVLGAALVWQAYVVTAAFRFAPRFQQLFLSLGAEIPPLTRALFATYRFWPAVPVLFVLLAIRAVRKTNTSVQYLAVLSFTSVLIGFVLQAWLYEGYFAPIFSLIKQIG